MKTVLAILFVLIFSANNKVQRTNISYRPFEPLSQSLDTLAVKSDNLLLLTQTLQDESN